MAETIQTVSISEETEERYLRYAMSVITSRALPDVRDGLKPVQRRILYTMEHELHLSFEGRARKCAQIVGDVMGKYHPHGDGAIYDALVRMAQEWVMLIPLVHGQGNFGSVDGDPPAAYRYTEAKLSQPASYLLRELRQQTVDMRPTYDASRDEPIVLPAEFPNLLVNGCSGIAVGMATNIPPHNIGEVLRACIMLIENPDATTAEIMNKIKGPDFPLGGKIVTERSVLRKIYEDGEGSIRVQGEWHVEGEDSRRPQIVITSIPYGVDKGNLENVIGEIISNRALPDAINMTNESNEKVGLRITIDLKPQTDPIKIMAYLFRHTALQQSYNFNLTCLVPDKDGHLLPSPKIGLKEILKHFLDFRLITVRRRFQYDLNQLKKRIHILEGFQIIFNALDEAIRLIRESNGKADAAEKLIKKFKLDQIQADAILEAQLYKIAQLEIQKILDELEEKTKEAKRIESILRSNKKLWDVISGELQDLAEKFPGRRRTRMASEEDVLEFNEEAYIVQENTNLVLTRDGWIKRVGRLTSVESTRVREGDEVIGVVPGSTVDQVVFFADDGTAYTMRMNEIPVSSGYGEPITKFFKLADQVKIISAECSDERFILAEFPGTRGNPPGPYILVVTQQGYTVRIPFSLFKPISTKNGRRYMRLGEGDRVVMAKILNEEESVFLASSDGHVLHFPLKQINIVASAARGVIGIKLLKEAKCLGGALVSDRHDALVVETTGGTTKECRRGAYPPVSRGGKGVEIVKRTELVRVVPPPIELIDWDKVDQPSKNGKPVDSSKKEDSNLFG